jgi:hypothetical protein
MSRSRCGGPDRNGQNKPSLRGNGDRPTIMIHDNKLNFALSTMEAEDIESKARKEADFFARFCAMYSASIVEAAKLTS